MNHLHHDCEPWAERITLLAAGCLSTDEEPEIRRHLEACPDCRERFGQLTQLCGALADAQLPVDVAEDAMFERVMSVVASDDTRRPIDQSEFDQSEPGMICSRQRSRSPDNWRWIMRSPVFHVSTAAVFILAVTFVALFFYAGGPTFAFADFAAPILESKTVRFKITIETKGPPVQTLTGELMVLEGVRMRQVTQLPDKSKVVVVQDLSQRKSLMLVPASKTATVLTSTSERNDKTPEFDAAVFFRLFQLIAEKPDAVEHESLGEKELDDRNVVGFRMSSQAHELTLWGDPNTGLPVRVETTSGIEGSVKATFSDFVFNADMDESLFSLEPPAGYTVTEQTVNSDVSPPEEEDLIEMLREYSELFDGAFPDSLDFLTTATRFGKKVGLRMGAQKMWEGLVPGKGKPNEEQMRTLEELMLKMTEGKPNEEQTKEIAAQIKAYVETQTGKTADVGETQETEESRQAQFNEAQFNEVFRRVQRGLQFVVRLPPSTDAHYVGQGVSFGAADTPIFWYRPADAQSYRVFYADLSVRDAGTPPGVTEGESEPAPRGPNE